MSNELFLTITNWFDIATVVFMAIIGSFLFRRLDICAKAILYLVVSSCILNNTVSYLQDIHISIIPMLYLSYFQGFVLISVFYNFSLPQFIKRRVGLYLMLTGCLFLMLNSIFYKPIGQETTYFGFYYYQSFYSLCSLALSVTGLFILFQSNKWETIRNKPVFWFFIILAFTECIGFFNSVMLPLVENKELQSNKLLYNIISYAFDGFPSDLANIGFGIIFLTYKKKRIVG